jgi:hypothetical protein
MLDRTCFDAICTWTTGTKEDHAIAGTGFGSKRCGNAGWPHRSKSAPVHADCHQATTQSDRAGIATETARADLRSCAHGARQKFAGYRRSRKAVRSCDRCSV